MSNVLNRVMGGGGSYPSVFFTSDDFTSQGSVTMTGEGRTYNGVWTSKVISGVTTYGFLCSKIKSFGNYSYTATQGTKTKTGSVLVDSVEDITEDVEFIYYLYNQGKEYEDRTGGWSGVTQNNGTVTINQTNVEGYSAQGYINSYGLYTTINKINLTGYSNIKIQVDEVVEGVFVFLSTSSRTGLDYELSTTTIGEWTIPITDYQGEYYIGIGGEVGGGAIKRGGKFSKVWLE